MERVERDGLDILPPETVYCCPAPPGPSPAAVMALPEFPYPLMVSREFLAVRELLHSAGLDRERFGSAAWNPLQALIRSGDTVLLKPNWVNHLNHSGAGLEPLVTHPQVVAAAIHYAAKARPRRLIIGDAPIQGCDLPALMKSSGMDQVIAESRTRGIDLEIKDFRRTTLQQKSLGYVRQENLHPLENYLPFDLGEQSALNGLCGGCPEFRVTMYDPAVTMANHRPGHHRYLIAREVIQANLVINLPKLKTHKKAGLTGAIKNAVGTVGSKDYLAHHRKGGSLRGGDCYAGRSLWKELAEDLLDAANRRHHNLLNGSLHKLAGFCLRCAVLAGHDDNLEGSWYGNDTVWRMTLDLQRILHYGKPDGGCGFTPQRRVLTITDAIVAGQGEGPMAPAPLPTGLLTMGLNVAAVDWVNALLLGLDPARIPLIREAFTRHPYALAVFPPSAIAVAAGGAILSQDQFFDRYSRPAKPPAGWAGHCEYHHQPQEPIADVE